jgi:hypothetical protein
MNTNSIILLLFSIKIFLFLNILTKKIDLKLMQCNVILETNNNNVDRISENLNLDTNNIQMIHKR